MIEEEAVVARIENGQVWVEKARRSACSGCTQTCTAGTLDAWRSGSTASLPVSSSIEVQPGDRVLIGLPEEAIVRGSCRVYLMPLAGLFVGAGLGQALLPSAADLAAASGGLLGLAATVFFLAINRVPETARIEPLVLRKLG